MSPEHFRAKAVPASDQYSLAVTLYEWLTGSPPFDEGDFMQLGYQHRYEPVPPLHEKNPSITVPPLLEQVVMKGLAKEPAQRFARIEAFANALEQALKPQNPIIVTPPAPPKPAIVSPPIGTTLVTYRKHTGTIWAVAWSPDDVHIASGSTDGTVQIWNAMTGSQKSNNKSSFSILAVAWSPDGKRLASGGVDKIVHLWDLMQQREILQYTGHTDWINALSWSPDGRYIVSGGGDASGTGKTPDFTLHIWDTTTGRRQLTYKGHTINVNAIQWSPDGIYIASSGDDVVQVWEVKTGRLIYTYTKHIMDVQALAWSKDSRRLTSGSLDKTVQVWDALTGNKVLRYGGHTNAVETVAWSPDGRPIASGSWDNTVHIWDATTGKTIYTYQGHSNIVNALSWSPDSTRIVFGGEDNTVQVWQAR